MQEEKKPAARQSGRRNLTITSFSFREARTSLTVIASILANFSLFLSAFRTKQSISIYPAMLGESRKTYTRDRDIFVMQKGYEV
ncbi:hypothetical protein ACFQUX_01660 [Pantoea stewartii]